MATLTELKQESRLLDHHQWALSWSVVQSVGRACYLHHCLRQYHQRGGNAAVHCRPSSALVPGTKMAWRASLWEAPRRLALLHWLGSISETPRQMGPGLG
jgi:hypothetical protein